MVSTELRIHPFSPRVVRRVIPPGRAGAYALGHSGGLGFVAGYVGRSARCVCERLAAHERLGEFDAFVVRLAPGAEGAFNAECELWHAYHQTGTLLRNLVHPATPSGAGLICPYCHFARHVRHLLLTEPSGRSRRSARTLARWVSSAKSGADSGRKTSD